MPSVHLRGVSFTHATTPVLSDVDLDVTHDPAAHGSGWVGVVGANGAGKSTLLRLVAGELAPTTGRVDVTAAVPPVLLRQDPPATPAEVTSFAWSWDGDAQRLRRRLALDPDDVVEGAGGRGWRGLSPGLRTRWRIAAALHAEPDLLLLDEPTNHLDAEGRSLLVAALRAHTGLGLVVSHDRALLEELTTRTLRVHAGGAVLHPGAHARAAARWRAEEARVRAEADRAEAHERRERAALADLRRARHGAEASAARDRRTAGPRDPDAREVGRKVRAARSEAAIARRVAAQRTRVERAATAGPEPARDHRGAIGFHAGDGSPRDVLAALRGEVRHAGGDVQLHDVDVALLPGDRVRVAGRNGAGKSTLVAALLAALPDTVRVGVLAQEVDEDVLAVLGRLDPTVRGRVLGTAARLGVVPGHVLDRAATSPGERRKVRLAMLLVDDVDLVVLDEPTNHLDLPAVEALQDALAAWGGTLLLVTHDDALAAATTTATWTVTDGRVHPSSAGAAPDARVDAATGGQRPRPRVPPDDPRGGPR